MLLTRFEQKNGHLSQVEMFAFMCLISTKIPPHDSVPGGVVLIVRLLLNMGQNVLLYAIFLKHLSSTPYQVLLHLLCHVGIFYHSLSSYLRAKVWLSWASWGK
uniref:Uncharacterized protein n=1 Tax=Equus asinus TaxID=9793 RepID=A0A8C4L1V2_EQUAS